MADLTDCLDHGNPAKDPCSGEIVVYYSDLGTRIERCTLHADEAEASRAKTRRDYPDSDTPPSWFDPSYAGERWDDDY